MGKAAGNDRTNEALQLVIMILLFTSAGLALFSGFFYFFYIPGQKDELQAQTLDANKLYELLDSRRIKQDAREIYNLRDRYLDHIKNPITKDIQQIVLDALPPLKSKVIPQTTVTKGVKGGPTELKQAVDLEEASLKEILLYITRVQQENPSILVGHLGLNRGRRGASGPGASGGDDDRWAARLEFHLFQAGGQGGAAAAGAKAAKAEKAEADPLSPEIPSG